MSGHYLIAILFMIMYLIIHFIFYKTHQIENDAGRVFAFVFLPFVMLVIIIFTIMIDTEIGTFILERGWDWP